MCELAMLMLIAVIATGYLVEQLRSRGGGRRGRHRAARDVYESSLGLADDPEDEWIEWAIMDDLDGEW